MICPTHHTEMRSLGATFVCPACLSLGAQGAVKLLEDFAAKKATRLVEERIEGAGIPSTFAAATFQTWKAPSPRALHVAEVMGKYAKDFSRQRLARNGFIFIGPPGTGKTHIGCAIIQELARTGFAPRYISLPAFTREIKGSYSKPGHTDTLLRGVIDADFVVIDEIDLHGTSDVDYNTLYDIINGRYEKAGYPTLVISNRDLERLTSDLDVRIISRILGPTNPILFDWENRRSTRLSKRKQEYVKA